MDNNERQRALFEASIHRSQPHAAPQVLRRAEDGAYLCPKIRARWQGWLDAAECFREEALAMRESRRAHLLARQQLNEQAARAERAIEAAGVAATLGSVLDAMFAGAAR